MNFNGAKVKGKWQRLVSFAAQICLLGRLTRSAKALAFVGFMPTGGRLLNRRSETLRRAGGNFRSTARSFCSVARSFRAVAQNSSDCQTIELYFYLKHTSFSPYYIIYALLKRSGKCNAKFFKKQESCKI
jgi:hypothetical protein